MEGNCSAGDFERVGGEDAFGVGVFGIKDEVLVAVDLLSVNAMDDMVSVDFEFGFDPLFSF